MTDESTRLLALTVLVDSLSPLEAWFAATVGRHRVVALLSPT